MALQPVLHATFARPARAGAVALLLVLPNLCPAQTPAPCQMPEYRILTMPKAPDLNDPDLFDYLVDPWLTATCLGSGPAPRRGCAQVSDTPGFLRIGHASYGSASFAALIEAFRSAPPRGLTIGQSNLLPSDFEALRAWPTLEAVALGETGPEFVTALVQACPNLTRLKIQLPLGAGLADIAKLERLEVLDLEGSHLEGSQLTALAGMRHLRCLSLSHTGLAGSGLSALAALPALEALSVSENADLGVGLAELSAIPTLTWLDLRRTLVHEAGDGLLAGLPLLRVVLFEEAILPSPLLRGVAACKQIHTLDMTGCVAGAGGMEAVATLQSLRTFGVPLGTLDDQGVELRTGAQIEAFPVARVHEFSSTYLRRLASIPIEEIRTDGWAPNPSASEGLKDLVTLRSLKRLHLQSKPIKLPFHQVGEWPIRGAHLRQVGALTQLEELRISGNLRLSGSDWEPIAQLPHLRVLEASGQLGGTRALQVLSQCRSLQYLRFQEWNGAGGAGLSALSTLSNLEHLEVWCKSATPEEIASLASLPRLRYLSIGINTNKGKDAARERALAVARISSLEHLSIPIAITSPEDLKPLATLPRLRELLIETDLALTRDAALVFDTFPSLCELRIAGRTDAQNSRLLNELYPSLVP